MLQINRNCYTYTENFLVMNVSFDEALSVNVWKSRVLSSSTESNTVDDCRDGGKDDGDKQEYYKLVSFVPSRSCSCSFELISGRSGSVFTTPIRLVCDSAVSLLCHRKRRRFTMRVQYFLPLVINGFFGDGGMSRCSLAKNLSCS